MQTKITTARAAIATIISTTLLSGCFWDDPKTAAKYVSDNIDKDSVVEHLEVLESLASQTSDGLAITRAAGAQGYQDSLQYIIDVMEEHDYLVQTQEFDFRAWEELGGTQLFSNETELYSIKNSPSEVEPDYAVMSYSGNSNGLLSGEIGFVTPDFRFDASDYDSTDGCESDDFIDKELTNKIAVIQRGGCTFDAKVMNAQQAGAIAVIVFNQGNSDGRKAVVNGTLGSNSQAQIPAIGLRHDIARTWLEDADLGTVNITLNVSTKDEIVVTQNILAETKNGNPDNIVMLGAHLDSVPEGPGINDNGSGTAGLLEYAVTLANLHAPVKNKVRFAWWAAEEAGLVGSNYYTNSEFTPLYNQATAEILKQFGFESPAEFTQVHFDLVERRYDELNNIKLYLNFDMIGSPNYIYGVMDGDLSDTKDSPDNAYTGDFTPPKGTSDIENIFTEFFTLQGEATVPQALSKRSDYAGFADWGVAFGGLFTGAEKVKTDEQAALFGGEAGIAYDKCYHQTCDDNTNISQQALFVNTQSLAYVTTYYAMSQPLFPAPQAEPRMMRSLRLGDPSTQLRIGTKLKAAPSTSDHDHFHGDFDQDNH